MFNKLSHDVLLIIICNLSNISDVNNFASINKDNYITFDNSFYIYWGRTLYSKDFWDKANSRTPCLSKPLINMKMELLRIYNFEKHQIKYGFQLWTKEDYYKYWDSMEEYINSVNCKNCINSINYKKFDSQFINNELTKVLSIL